MGQTTIEWTATRHPDGTVTPGFSFNPWVGCAKISAACTSCYAEGWARRTGQAGLWRGERRRTSDANWRAPLRWNRDTPGAKVFCASLADLFEDHPAILPEWRRDLFELIGQTPNLTWLLLTKRPENVLRFVPRNWDLDDPMWYGAALLSPVPLGWPPNVWIGTTVEDQQRADERIPHLLRIPARVRFLSCEPLLGPIDLGRWLQRIDHCSDCEGEHPPLREDRCPTCPGGGPGLISTWGEDQADRYRTGERYANDGPGPGDDGPQLQWVISGGESGPRARPSNPGWFTDLRDQCQAAGVPYFFKQWGEWAPGSWTSPARSQGSQLMAWDGRRKDATEAFDPVAGDALVLRVGKARAGRELDGRTWDEVPG